MNPLAQFQKSVTIEEVLASPIVAVAAAPADVLLFHRRGRRGGPGLGQGPGRSRVLASVVRSGTGDTEYHDRLGQVAEEGWKAAGVGPADLDLVELHDATSAEELYALEAMGFFAPGDAGAATFAGATGLGGSSVCVNPSGGLVARGHPIGATGLCQIVEVTRAAPRPRREPSGTRCAHGWRAVNTGGLINADPALVSITVLGR